VPRGQLAQLARLVGGQNEIVPGAPGPDADGHAVEMTTRKTPYGRSHLTAVRGRGTGDEPQLLAAQPVRRIGVLAQHPAPVLGVRLAVRDPHLAPRPIRHRLQRLLPGRRQHPVEVPRPGHRVAARRGQRLGQIEHHHEVADGRLPHHRVPRLRGRRRRAGQQAGAGPVGADRAQPALPVAAVHEQQAAGPPGGHRGGDHRAGRQQRIG
jgi:hypothetical protein